MEQASSWQIHAEVHRDLKLLLSSSSNACVCTDLVATHRVCVLKWEKTLLIFLIQFWKLGLPEIWIVLVMLHGAILWPFCCFQQGVKLLLLNVRNKKRCIYSDAVNDQGAVLKRLHSEGAEQCFSISKPAEGRDGVSINWAVEHSSGTVDDSLRHVGFTLQHRGLWGYSTYLRDQDMCWKLRETNP